jgi:selenocysteine lyase/cysteine desulfurase
VVEIEESSAGGPDLHALGAALRQPADLVICAFSAASNVTGIVTCVPTVTRMAKAAGARMVWDYAGAGPYLPIAMSPNGENGAGIDAVTVSPHKFIGGPGASGVLIVRRDAVVATRPTWPGGGTVKYVSPTGHDYSDSLEAREEAGTPNVVGDIRAALAFLVKEAIGAEIMQARNAGLTRRAIAAWRGVERLDLLGPLEPRRLPVFSFRVRDGKGGYVHHQLVTRMLSDRFGIQARGGCACAGPYVHRLLGIDAAEAHRLRQAIIEGREMAKPGFVRLNFSVLLSDEEVAFIMGAVAKLATDATRYEPRYDVDPARAIFFPRAV